MTHLVSLCSVVSNNTRSWPVVSFAVGGSKLMTTSLLFMHPNSLLSHCFERTRHYSSLTAMQPMKAREERTYLLFYPAQPPVPTACARRMGRTSPHAFLTGPLLTGALRCGMHDLCVPFASSHGSTGSKRVASPLVKGLALTAL